MESSRKKSCDACRLAKTRCNLSTPICRRCQTRNLPCKYSHRKGSATPFSQNSGGMFNSWLAATNSEQLPSPGKDDASGELNRATAHSNQDGTFRMDDSRNSGFEYPLAENDIVDDFFPLESMELSGLGQRMSMVPETWAQIEERIESDPPAEDIFWSSSQICTSAPPQTSRPSPASPSHGIPTTAGGGPFSSYLSSMKHSSALVLASWQVLSQVPESEHVSTLLSRRPTTKLSSLVIGNRLWATIEEYPMTFVRKTLPPFVHRDCWNKEAAGKDESWVDLPEPLANCCNIVPMYRQKTPASSKMVMKTLLLEVQRMHEEFQGYNEMALIYALQALTMYLILLAADPATCRNIRAFVAMAMGEICLKVYNDGNKSTNEARRNYPVWEDWIRDESRRRTLIVLHLMNMLVDMNLRKPRTETQTCSGFDPIPLPCSKAMWEAGTKNAWELEYKKCLSNRKGNGTMRCGDLRKMNVSYVNDLAEDAVEDLANWSKDADGLGGMLLLAVQMDCS